MDIKRKIKGIKKMIQNGVIIDAVDVTILINEIERLNKKIKYQQDKINILESKLEEE